MMGGVQTGDDTFHVPDVVATCAPSMVGARSVADPFLIAEVIPPSDGGEALSAKLRDYAALPSVRELWLIDSRKRWVEQRWRAGEDRWVVRLPLTGSATFESPTLGGEPVALDRLYRNTGL